jgi:hypothetical protein
VRVRTVQGEVDADQHPPNVGRGADTAPPTPAEPTASTGIEARPVAVGLLGRSGVRPDAVAGCAIR